MAREWRDVPGRPNVMALHQPHDVFDAPLWSLAVGHHQPPAYLPLRHDAHGAVHASPSLTLWA